MPLIAAIVTAVVVPYSKSRTTAAQQSEIAAWVRIAVTAAEQIYTGTGRGKEKKKYVEDWLKAHGVTVDSEKLDALIRADSGLSVRRRRLHRQAGGGGDRAGHFC